MNQKIHPDKISYLDICSCGARHEFYLQYLHRITCLYLVLFNSFFVIQLPASLYAMWVSGRKWPELFKIWLVIYCLYQEEKAYPPEAIKHFHEKVLPSKEKRPVDHHVHHINQPK